MDTIDDDPQHPLNHFLDLLANAIERYENVTIPRVKSSPVEMLRFFMEQNNLTQADLKSELSNQAIVSQVLNGKRRLNLKQIQALAKRFHVDPTVFMEG